MTAEVTRLCTNVLALRRRYAEARDAFTAFPTLARMDERMAALKAYFVKVRGTDWADRLPEVMERERRECVAAMRAKQTGAGE